MCGFTWTHTPTEPEWLENVRYQDEEFFKIKVDTDDVSLINTSETIVIELTPDVVGPTTG